MNNLPTIISPKDGVYGVDSGAAFTSFSRQVEQPSSTMPGAPVVQSRDNTNVVPSRFIPWAGGQQDTSPPLTTRPVVVGKSETGDADVGSHSVVPAKLAGSKPCPQVQRLTGLIDGDTLTVDETLNASTMGALCHILKEPNCGLAKLVITIKQKEMSPDVARMLSMALKVNRTLTHLRVYNAATNSNGLAWLMDEVAEALKINQTHGAARLMGAVADALKTNQTLTSLCFSSIKIGDDIAASLSEALTVNRSLTNLRLLSVETSADGSARLLNALKVNSTITELDLSGSGNANAAALLWEVLKVNKTLTTFHFEGTKIADKCVGLSNALKVNDTLTTLSLFGSLDGDEGVVRLSEALKVNKALTKLDLRACRIGTDGAGTLAEALKVNLTLTSLDLQDYTTHRDAKCTGSIASSLQRNQQFHLTKKHAAGFMELASGLGQFPSEISDVLIEQMAALPPNQRQESIASIKAMSAAIGGPR
ncbi:hypothetical protein KTQ42_14060|uniref:hypothetical protein n=1 Tax=Noviherbaspirillum sp. L7-7A TaxID=2850560 RepID=UPI001C2C8440|nr:hypothetical protein [Noviherbaspirillum sp. L7-7A]MBV0880433.1 hypothetical protein [Noviherbaspirillum sp. L7-7A]